MIKQQTLQLSPDVQGNSSLHAGLAADVCHEREREVFYILCPASSLMDVPGYVNPDKVMNAPIGFVCRQRCKTAPQQSGIQGIAELESNSGLPTSNQWQQ